MKKNLLVISDSINLYYIAGAIFGERYRVLYADNEKEAFAVLDENPIRLIILSPMMRGTDGLRFLERLRNPPNPETAKPAPPAVLLGARLPPSVVIRAAQAGVEKTIELPLEPLGFDRAVEEIILKYSPAREKPDPVTGLPKKPMGQMRIEELLRDGTKGALMLVELDHYSFASTAVSNETLIICRDIICEEIDDKAVLAAVKGGGFLLFVPGMKERVKIENYAARLIRKITYKIVGRKVYVSMGLAVSERHGKSYEDLYQACDKGLGVARDNGKNIARFYNW
ncbi:MAG: response regulator [Oscillospiraceae bacterium]|nr:response regulator [Oscillospiraceae bacterium]